MTHYWDYIADMDEQATALQWAIDNDLLLTDGHTPINPKSPVTVQLLAAVLLRYHDFLATSSDNPGGTI